MRRLFATGLFLTAVLATASSSATQFRRPFDNSLALGYGFDHDGGASGCKDYNCGGTCYDGHKGSDFSTPYGTTIVATAAGTVTFVSGGCADVGFIGSTCGGGYGNYVRIQHADGKLTYHAHLKDGSIAVSNGQAVSCGQKVGESASSGNSSGYHHHFEVRPSAADDPYAGQCGGPVSYWVQQNGYGSPVGATCEASACACTPGQTDTQGCGNCGTQTRSCDASCQWGGFGSCGGQGTCSPNATESMACGDCGQSVRACQSDCSWGDYGGCAGPDPQNGDEVCVTELPGICSDGRVRCVEGFLGCMPAITLTDEVCDSLDNDCNGEVDDGSPEVLSDPPPALAATLVDHSVPAALHAGEHAFVWADFKNSGLEAWPASGLWLASLGGAEGKGSAFYEPGLWPAYDVAAVVGQDVAPGETGRFTFEIVAPSGVTEAREWFQVMSPKGALVACPAPAFEVAIQTLPALPLDEAGEESAAEDAPHAHASAEEGGCSVGRVGSSDAGRTLPWLLGLALLATRRSRAGRGSLSR